MADPTPYERSYSFTDFQAGNPSAPLPGVQVDNELENVEQSLEQVVNAIKDVRRSDGKLKNGIVTVDSLDPTVAAGVGSGALASAAAAAASASAAADSAEAAVASAGSAAGYSNTAATSAGQAMTFRNEAEAQKTLAQTARMGAQTARDFAAQWSSAPQGQDVNDGVNPVNKSAYHWAQVALGAATGTIPDGSVTTAKLANGALSADATGRAKMADGFVTSAKIADGTIATVDLADGAVTSAKIADGTIATGDIADSAITSVKIADGTIATGDLADGAVTRVKLATSLVATQTDQEAASSNATFITPGTQRFHPSAAKAFACVTQTGGTYTLQSGGSANVASIEKRAVGTVRVSWSNAFSGGFYCVLVSPQEGGAFILSISATTTTYVDVLMRTTGGAAIDVGFSLVVFGDI